MFDTFEHFFDFFNRLALKELEELNNVKPALLAIIDVELVKHAYLASFANDGVKSSDVL